MKFLNPFNSFIFEKWGTQKHYIKNIETYNQEMSSTIEDKIFFLEYCKPDLIVDFGCAGGTTLFEINKLYPNIKLIGYDLSTDMLDMAKNKVTGELFTNKWSEVKEKIKEAKNPLLLLSSVIHEVYSYSLPIDVNKFWFDVFNSGFKYVAIRDMIPSSLLDKMEVTNEEYNKILDNVSDIKVVKDFENIWGPINKNRRNLVHFLLKYHYFNDNWDRELLENYVPITKKTLDKKIPSNWFKVYESSFTLPYLKNKVKNDFGIILNDKTHIKLLLERII